MTKRASPRRRPGGVASVSAGGVHTCGVRTGGSVECWGNDEEGQSTPPSGGFASVSAGFGHTCGVRTGGSVECWGNDEDGQSTPPSGGFASVSAGYGTHTCGVRTGGSVQCWGNDEYGTGPRRPASSPPSAPGVLPHVRGEDRRLGPMLGQCRLWPVHAAVRGVRLRQRRVQPHVRGEDRRLGQCWGDDGGESTPPRGQSTPTPGPTPPPGQSTPTSGEFASVSAGYSHTCGVRTDGSVECWGNVGGWQGHAADREFASVSAGESHSAG